MTKVKVTREVAEAIESRRKLGYSDYAILRNASGRGTARFDETIRNWAFDEDGAGSADLLMQALVNGYEVEKTPEDKLLAEFKAINGACTAKTEFGRNAIERRKGFMTVVETLGIKIGGINA